MGRRKLPFILAIFILCSQAPSVQGVQVDPVQGRHAVAAGAPEPEHLPTHGLTSTTTDDSTLAVSNAPHATASAPPHANVQVVQAFRQKLQEYNHDPTWPDQNKVFQPFPNEMEAIFHKRLEFIAVGPLTGRALSFPPLSKFNWITRVVFEGFRIHPLSPCLFNGMKQLESINMVNMGLTALPDTIFADLENVRTLYLAGNNFEETPVEALRRLKNLESLDISGNHVELRGIEKLYEIFPNLSLNMIDPRLPR